MLKRNLIKTDFPVSVLGLGCMRLPKRSPDGDEIDDAKAQEIVDYAFAHGVNYFDTAYRYHAGASEPFLGRALKKYGRSCFFLATKLPVWMLKTPEDAERIFTDQLNRLQTDYFDFYLLHSLNKANFEKAERLRVYDFLLKQKKAGTIRHLGFSFHDTPEVLEKICGAHPWDFAQIQLNYLDWETQRAREKYEILTKRGLPVIVMEPVRGGALADLGEASNRLLKTARPEWSVASWAVRFAAGLPNVMTVLSGMSTLGQVADNAAAMKSFEPLTAGDREVLRRAAEAYKRHITIPCTGCRYCMDCPHGVDIPKMFRLYNRYALNRDTGAYRAAYEASPPAERAQQCVACGRCVPLCPQGIPIPQRLSLIREKTEKLFD